MSYNYYDPFGKSKNTTTKYYEVEAKAARLLSEYVEGQYTQDEFADLMLDVLSEVQRIDKDGVVIDENYPMWMANFFSFNFIDWHKWRRLVKYHDMYPEQYENAELQARYEELCERDFDGKFMEECKDLVNGFKKEGRKF